MFTGVLFADDTFRVCIIRTLCRKDTKSLLGRGKTTPAYAHSLSDDHHVYINLQTLKVYILPENYQVKSAALDDIKYVANPTFTKAQVAKMDKDNEEKYTLQNEKYVPGITALNLNLFLMSRKRFRWNKQSQSK
jgi:hypothetical protein